MASLITNYEGVREASSSIFKSTEGYEAIFSADYHAILIETANFKDPNCITRLTLEHDLENFLYLFANLIILEENRSKYTPSILEPTITNINAFESL